MPRRGGNKNRLRKYGLHTETQAYIPAVMAPTRTMPGVDTSARTVGSLAAQCKYLHYAHKHRIVQKLGNDTQRIHEQILGRVSVVPPLPIPTSVVRTSVGVC